MGLHKKDWFIIINPHSGSSYKRSEVEIALKRQEVSYTIIETDTKDVVSGMVEKAVYQGYNKFMAMGGDGSSNVLINALMKNKHSATADLIFANVSCGTGNDWQRGRKWPKIIDDQIALIKRGHVQFMDVGKVSYPKKNDSQDYFFHNMLGLAYDAFVVHNMSQSGKKKMGPLIYIYSVVKYIFQFDIPRLHLKFNDLEIDEKLYTVNIAIGTHAGSGMQICPHAINRKDQFAILIAHNMSKLRVLLESIRFYTGSIHKSQKTSTFFSREINANSSSKPMQVEADGEVLPSGEIDVVIVNKALQTIKI